MSSKELSNNNTNTANEEGMYFELQMFNYITLLFCF